MGETELVNKILLEEKLLKETYPEKSVLDDLKEKKIDAKIKAEKMLGKILDKMLLVEKFIELIPLHYDEAGLFWLFDESERYWKMIDEVDILNWIHASSEANIITPWERAELLNAIKQVARRKKPQVLPKDCIQFKKEIVNLQTGDRFPASAQYFATNPLPYALKRHKNTPTIERLFAEWVKPQDVPKLFEVVAFCMIPDYFIERVICLHGSGSNGKSLFRMFLRKFIGEKNICSTSFETLLHSRFETAKLYKKLVCEMGETNLKKIENTQLIKRLVSGKDLVGAEFKNKKPFDFLNGAKLIISTNNLPPTEDKTDGFYRKWLIIDFPNTFSEEKDVLSTIPEEEYEALTTKCLEILDYLMKRRVFTNEGDFAQRKEKYESLSNPFEKFYVANIDDSNPNADLPKWEFEKRLNDWLKENRLRMMSDITICRMMKEKGNYETKPYKQWYENDTMKSKQVRCWGGLGWKT